MKKKETEENEEDKMRRILNWNGVVAMKGRIELGKRMDEKKVALCFWITCDWKTKKIGQQNVWDFGPNTANEAACVHCMRNYRRRGLL